MILTKTNKNMFIFLLVITILTALGNQGWRSIFNNYAVEIVNITGQEMGALQSIREIPGFLALLVVYILIFIKEHKLAALSLIIFGIGIAITGLATSFWGLAIAILIMSFGFHYYETINQSLTLQYFSKTAAPLIMAKFTSIKAATNIIVGGLIFLGASFLSYSQIFFILGIIICVGGIWCLSQNPSNKNIPPQHKKMIFKKKYSLFYLLTMFAGARRQIFVAFAVFLLVQKFNFSVKEITILFVVNNIITYFLMPHIGKMINTKGERFVLSLEYFSLIFIFLAYAFTTSKAVVAGLYVIDHIFFGFAIAIKSYFQKTADKGDIAPSMAVGFTINHLVAVILPVTGGLLWMVDYKIPFILGAILSLFSLFLVQKIKSE